MQLGSSIGYSELRAMYAFFACMGLTALLSLLNVKLKKTAYLLFCIVQTVGKEPEKDCMTDYNRSKSNAETLRKKEKEQRRLQGNSEKQPNEIKKEKEKIIKKFDQYLFELNQKSRRQRASK